MAVAELDFGTDWMRDTPCRGTDPELWFPSRGVFTGPARAICTACPFRLECLTAALQGGERFGMWGGTSERERRAIRRRVLERQRAGSSGWNVIASRGETEHVDRRMLA